MSERIPVAVLAATGSVGQRFVQLLDQHPYFEVKALTASDRSVGQPYSEACHWLLPEPMPEWARKIMVTPTTVEGANAPLAFSALPTDIAKTVEPQFAQAGVKVFSNASAYRQAPDVPILLPEVNPQQVKVIEAQRKNHGWSGYIVTNSNCTSTGMTVALKALQDAFGLQLVFAVSMQALSGAGYPGVPSMDIIDNVIPYIGGEEEKVEWEPRKMLGQVEDGEITLADFVISAHSNRVRGDGWAHGVPVGGNPKAPGPAYRRGSAARLSGPRDRPGSTLRTQASDRGVRPTRPTTAAAGPQYRQWDDDRGGPGALRPHLRHQTGGAVAQHGARRGGWFGV